MKIPQFIIIAGLGVILSLQAWECLAIIELQKTAEANKQIQEIILRKIQL
jgi:hypothetical protein